MDKVFKRGSEEIHVLGGLDLQHSRRRIPGADGAIGVREIDLTQPDRRARPAQPGFGREIGGERIDKLSNRKLPPWRARHIGLVFQFYNLMPVLTAQKNVELPLLLTHLSRSERKKRAAIALDIVGFVASQPALPTHAVRW